MKHPYTRPMLLLLLMGLMIPLSAQQRLSQDAEETFFSDSPNRGLSYQSSFGLLTLNGSFIQSRDLLEQAGYRNGLGMGIEVLSRPVNPLSRISLRFGAKFDFSANGRERFDTQVEIPVVSGAEYSIANRQTSFHGVAQISTSERLPVQLYGMGMLGTRVFGSQELWEIYELDHSEECPEPDNILRSWTLSYGGAAGMRIRLSDAVLIDMRATYLDGTGARFVDLESVGFGEAGDISYGINRAARSTSMVYSLGVSFVMDDVCCTPSRSTVTGLQSWR